MELTGQDTVALAVVAVAAVYLASRALSVLVHRTSSCGGCHESGKQCASNGDGFVPLGELTRQDPRSRTP